VQNRFEQADEVENEQRSTARRLATTHRQRTAAEGHSAPKPRVTQRGFGFGERVLRCLAALARALGFAPGLSGGPLCPLGLALGLGCLAGPLAGLLSGGLKRLASPGG
jgi:hypothetical protein